MVYLNLLYFVLITYWAFKLLKTSTGTVKGALDKKLLFRYSGPELFWCLTFSTSLLALSLNLGIDLMAVRLGVLDLLCVIGLNTVRNRPILSLPVKVYIALLIWMVIGCLYGPSLSYGIRMLMKYVYPLLICMLASAVVRDGEVFLKSSLLARLVAAASAAIILFMPYRFVILPGVLWGDTASAINFISMLSLSLGLFYFDIPSKKKNNLFFIVLFILPCFFKVLRTSIMGSLVAIMAFYFMKYKLKSLPIIVGVIMAGIVAVFTIPSLRDKMFFDKNVTMEQFKDGKLDESSINTNAREGMWKHLDAQFFQGHEIIGSGTASVQHYMYTHHVFGGLKMAHSDFVQLRCDNGLIGLILFALAAFSIYFSAFRTYWSTNIPILKLSAIVAGASMAGIFVTCYSDNVVNYTVATLSMPFGFYGMMLGLKKHYNQ